MVYKTYIDKFNTIIKDSEINTGINPVSELVYGRDGIVSRALIHFDHNKVKSLICDGTMPHIEKMRHVLHITNAGSLDFTQLHDCGFSMINANHKMRATSFDLIFFLIPKPWDRGKGFDYTKTYLRREYYSMAPMDPTRLVSEEGSNWFQRVNGIEWDEEGVYDVNTLSKEYDNFASDSGTSRIVIARQHFDIGNENVEIDITDIFNKFITGDYENNGIGIAFSPLTEGLEKEYENYLALLTDKTSLWFAPYVETRYDDFVSDDRTNFVLGKNNKIYLYCTIGDELRNLDNIPTVTIKDNNDNIVVDANGEQMENVQANVFSKGIYYVDVKLSAKDYTPNTMLFDTWDNISYEGVSMEPIELDFTLKSTPNYFNIGYSIPKGKRFSPSVSGIMEAEVISRGDIRRLSISAMPQYTNNLVQLVDEMEIRLYVKDGTREVDAISWDKINKSFIDNFYIIDTNILLPQRYYIDIKIKYGMESIIHHNVLYFDIADSLNNKYA